MAELLHSNSRIYSKPKDLSHHFSHTATHVEPNILKDFYKYFAIPDIAQVAGGTPNASFFPFDTLEASIALPTRFRPSPNDPVDPPALAPAKADTDTASTHFAVPKVSSTTNPLQKIDLATALQYGTSEGYPPLRSFIHHFTTECVHPNIPYAAEVCLTVGSTDGFSKVLRLFSNEWSKETSWPSERDGLLVEDMIYMAPLQFARPRGVNIVNIALDDLGMRAYGKGGLQDVLESWDEKRGKRPHIMYTVTMGHNPTGVVMPLSRRREIYALCQEYDIIIIEDDPYWHLQYPSANPTAVAEPKPSEWRTSGYEFLDSLVPSYLQIDVDGRVVRLDTFSKTIAPGCRLGWITAQPAFIEKLLRGTDTTTQQPSGFVQSLVVSMIDGVQPSAAKSTRSKSDFSGWNTAGWVRWLAGLRGVYERRMNLLRDALDAGKYLTSSTDTISKNNTENDTDTDNWTLVTKTPLYNFVVPSGGMFLWLTLNFSSHPSFPLFPLQSLSRALWIFWTTPAYLVLVAPGWMFAATDAVRAKSGYETYRTCFAALDTDEQVEDAGRRLAAGVSDFWGLSGQEIREILRKDEEGAGDVVRVGFAGDGVRNLFGVC